MAEIVTPKKLQKVDHGCILTARDLIMMTEMARFGFLTIEDIWQHFRTSRGANAHFRRVRKLTDSGFLAPIKGDGKIKLGYRLTRRGTEALNANGVDIGRKRSIRRRYRSIFDHDQMLHHIESILTKSILVTNYVVDSELRSEMAKSLGSREARKKALFVPDSVFDLKTYKGVFKVALELELTPKSIDRYRKKLAYQLTTSSFQVVLFLVENEDMRRRIEDHHRYLKSHDLKVKLSDRQNTAYFCHVKEFLEKKENAPFSGADGTFSLRSLEQAFKEKGQLRKAG